MKTALVTGASKGIGRAIAIELATEGYQIVFTYKKDRSSALKVQKIIQNIGVPCEAVRVDITKNADIKRLTNFLQKYNKLDLLVNNAGIDYDLLIEEYPTDKLKEVLNTNLIGPILLTKAIIPYLKKSKDSPQIINIASRMGNKKLIPGVGAYAPSKAGLLRFTQICALELQKYGIRANAVCPGFTPTNVYRKIYPDPQVLNNVVQEVSASNPCRRVATPEDTAYMVGFLASHKGSYINGEAIVIDGGSNLG